MTPLFVSSYQRPEFKVGDDIVGADWNMGRWKGCTATIVAIDRDVATIRRSDGQKFDVRLDSIFLDIRRPNRTRPIEEPKP